MNAAALVGNDWRTLNADVAALEDRGHVLLFEPTALEVHRQAAGWFWDQQIFDFVAGHLHLIAQHSLRTYRQAWELKRAGLDWRRAVLSRCLTGPALLVARLKADPSYPSEARVAEHPDGFFLPSPWTLVRSELDKAMVGNSLRRAQLLAGNHRLVLFPFARPRPSPRAP